MKAVLAVTSFGMLLSNACAAGPGTQEPSLPPKPQVVEVAMDEYRFEYEPPQFPGRIIFQARNRGREAHELTLVALPENMLPIADQLASGERRPVATIAVMPERQPGEEGSFAVDLPPGRYALLCFVSDAKGELHALKGMNAEFRISGTTEGRTDPVGPEASSEGQH